MLKALPCGVEEALVSGTNPIPDAQMTASSSWHDGTAPRQARISNTAGNGAWRCSDEELAAPQPRMYIQVRSLVTIQKYPSQTVFYYYYYYLFILLLHSFKSLISVAE